MSAYGTKQAFEIPVVSNFFRIFLRGDPGPPEISKRQVNQVTGRGSGLSKVTDFMQFLINNINNGF